MRYPAIILTIPHLLQLLNVHHLTTDHLIHDLVVVLIITYHIAYQIHHRLHPIVTSEAMTVLPIVLLQKLPTKLQLISNYCNNYNFLEWLDCHHQLLCH